MAKNSAPDVGDLAIDFTLIDTGGREIRLGSYRDQHPVLLVFNRGFF